MFIGIREELRLSRLMRTISDEGVLTPILRDGPHVIQGHRRVIAYASLMSKSPEDVLDCLPYREVRLGAADRIWRAIAPHDGLRLPLSEWEEYRAIEILTHHGVSDRFRVAEHFGLSPSWAQVRLTLAKLPKYIRDGFREWLTSPQSRVKLRWDAVPRLYKAFNSEIRQYPGGDGPMLTALYQEVSAVGQKPRRVMYTEGELKTIVQRSQSPLLRRLIEAVLNSDPLEEIDRSLSEHNL